MGVISVTPTYDVGELFIMKPIVHKYNIFLLLSLKMGFEKHYYNLYIGEK
nr:MAG TPA: hypothetical protein [Caudoviricetes sp.]